MTSKVSTHMLGSIYFSTPITPPKCLVNTDTVFIALNFPTPPIPEKKVHSTPLFFCVDILYFPPSLIQTGEGVSH